MITWDHFVIHLASVSLSGGLSGHEGIAEGAADGGRWGGRSHCSRFWRLESRFGRRQAMLLLARKASSEEHSLEYPPMA